MDTAINGKVALVCASTGGLGEAIARGLAAEGARVAITGRRADRARAISAELPGSIAIPGNLNEPSTPQSVVAETQDRLGPIDIAVLNGPGPAPAAAGALAAADFATALEKLVLTHHAVVSQVLPGMRERGWGRVLAVGSSGIAAPLPDLAASNAGRSALAAYLKTLAAEVAQDGVTVNLVLPGRIATDRIAQLDETKAKRQQRDVGEVRAASIATIPAGRYGKPEEFAAAAVFLCSTPASYITGTALRCDGGLVRTL